MNRKKALNIGISAIEDKMQVISVEANIAIIAPNAADSTHHTALEKYREYTEAIKEIERIRDTEQLSFGI